MRRFRGRADDEDDDERSIRTIVPHESERVDEMDEEQLAKQEWEEEQRQQHNEDDARGGLSSGDPGPLSLRAWA
jgi:hypothetical protein